MVIAKIKAEDLTSGSKIVLPDGGTVTVDMVGQSVISGNVAVIFRGRTGTAVIAGNSEVTVEIELEAGAAGRRDGRFGPVESRRPPWPPSDTGGRGET
jgi:hypothetical protein